MRRINPRRKYSFSSDRRQFWRDSVIAILWQATPTGLLLIAGWDADQEIFVYVAVICAFVVFPLLAGYFHDSGRIFLIALAIPFIAYAIMVLIFILRVSVPR